MSAIGRTGLLKCIAESTRNPKRSYWSYPSGDAGECRCPAADAQRAARNIRVSEMIVRTGGYCVEFILQAWHGHDRVVRGAGQRSALITKVVIIVFEIRRPVWGECPIHTGADRPAGPVCGRTGIDGDPRKLRESNVGLFAGPGGAALTKTSSGRRHSSRAAQWLTPGSRCRG